MKTKSKEVLALTATLAAKQVSTKNNHIAELSKYKDIINEWDLKVSKLENRLLTLENEKGEKDECIAKLQTSQKD